MKVFFKCLKNLYINEKERPRLMFNKEKQKINYLKIMNSWKEYQYQMNIIIFQK